MKKVRIYLAGTIYKEEPDKLWKRQLRDYFNPKEDVADQNLQNDMYEFFDPDPQPGGAEAADQIGGRSPCFPQNRRAVCVPA